MKIVLISDNHFLNGMESVLIAENADYAFHLGDSQLKQNDAEMSRFDACVAGNCDMREKFPLTVIETVGDMRWYLEHGDSYVFPHSQQSYIDFAKEHQVDVICSGHTHVPVYQDLGSVKILNPGSFARSRAKTPNSYMSIIIEDGSWQVYLKDAKTMNIIAELNG